MVFTTPIGSRLHGLHTEDSDHDMLTVLQSSPTKRQKVHKASKSEDSYTVGLGRFLHLADEGYHIALDAMFSPYANESWFDSYRQGYRVNLVSMHRNYHSLIQNFLVHSERRKHRRHALRMALNYRDALEHGWFSPVLSEVDAEFVHRMSGDEKFLEALCNIWPQNDLRIYRHKEILENIRKNILT